MNAENNKFHDYEFILNQVPCGIGIFEIESSMPVFLNDAYFDIIGYSREEYAAIQREQAEKLVYSPDMPISIQSRADFRNHGNEKEYEYRIVRKDGSIRWVKLNLEEIVIEQKKYAFASFSDFTAEKETYTRLNTISENIDSSISMFQVTSRGEELIYANPTFYHIIGIEPEQYRENALAFDRSFVSEEDYERVKTMVKDVIVTGQPGVLEHRFCRPDGSVLWVSRRCCAIKQERPDSYLLISVVTDITEQKLASLRSQIEKQRFQLVINELNAAVFEWNFQDGSFYSSEAYQKYAISAVSQEDILSNRGPIDLVHVDDQEMLQQFFMETDSGKDKAEITMRLKMTDGSFHWCRMIGLFFKDEKGNPERTIGMILDINEERERSFMLSTLLNGLPGGVAIFKYGKRLECQYYSDGFAKLSGRTRVEIDELLETDRLFDEVIAPSDLEQFQKKVKDAVTIGAPINTTYRYIMKDREIGWLHISASKLREEDGAPVYYCIFTNPTDETALYRSIAEDSPGGVFIAERKNRRILYMNERMGKLFHVPQRRLKQRMDNYDPLPKKYEVLEMEDILALKKDAYTEFHVVWDDRLHLIINAKALDWNGIDAYILYFTDETAEYEHQLQQQKLIDGVPGGIGIYEIIKGQASLVYLNDAYYRLLGQSREDRKQFLGTNVLEAVHPDDKSKFITAINEIMSGVDHVNVLHRVRNNKGEWIWLNHAASVAERKDDYAKLYVSYTDCNEIMQAQQEMQNYRIKLDAALNSTHVMEWEYDFKRKTITDSGALGTTYHMPKVIENVLDIFLEGDNVGLICAESVEDFRWLFEHCDEGKRIQKDIHCKAPDGKRLVWQRVVYTPIFDKDGKCVEMVGTAVDITEQKEREQHYEEQLRLAKIAAQEALATATYNLTKNMVTEAYSPRPELMDIMRNTDVDTMLKNIRQNTISREEEERFTPVYDAAAMMKTFSEGTSHIEIRHHLNTSTEWVQSTFDIIQNPFTKDLEAVATLRDISDAVRAELVVNRLLMLDYESIMTIDKKTGIVRTFRNAQADTVMQDMFSMLESQEDVALGVEKFYRKYSIPEDRERAIQENSPAHVLAELENEPVHMSLFTLQTSEKRTHKRVIYAYLDESKEIILCAVQDVTNTYEQEEKQRRELTQALKTAEYANQSKRDFLARMSHDMRTPMNGIIGVADLSLQETDPQTLRDNMYKIKESGGYLLSLINDTLDFQKIESGKLILNTQIVAVAPIFQNVIEMIKPAAEDKGVIFEVINHNAEMNWYVRIDPVRIQQIIFNLLSNAVKFTRSSGIVRMEIWNLSREGMISHNCIKISDTGIGMSEGFIQNGLYKPFSQERSKVSTQYAGSGLGLSIVHSLVEMMGGRMEVESQKGVGTTFTLYLDFERVDEEEAKQVIDMEKSKEFVLTEELSGKNILLVEDHPLNAQIAIKLLEKAGCHVTWMDNGEKGVQKFNASATGEYDAVLMDIRMPVMNGLEAATAIRQLEREDAARTPIIAMTANAYDEDVEKSLAAGMNAHLVKPINPTILYETLVRFLDSKN
ncbi:MAG: PAS domain S-box protein [Clostridia bacterium]|nr:PAS domain S-box protein [Clostridia bacterium]